MLFFLALGMYSMSDLLLYVAGDNDIYEQFRDRRAWIHCSRDWLNFHLPRRANGLPTGGPEESHYLAIVFTYLSSSNTSLTNVQDKQDGFG
jgi:hypothetical protein